MISQITALLGLLVIVGSMFLNAFAGTQLALLGVGLIMLAVFMEVRKR